MGRDLAAKQPRAAQVCHLMVSTLVIQPITWITTHLPTLKGRNAELTSSFIRSHLILAGDVPGANWIAPRLAVVGEDDESDASRKNVNEQHEEHADIQSAVRTYTK